MNIILFFIEPEYEYYYEYIYEEDLPDFQEKLAPTTTLVTTIPTKETLIEKTPIKKFDEPPHTASNGMYNSKQWFLNFLISIMTSNPKIEENFRS